MMKNLLLHRRQILLFGIAGAICAALEIVLFKLFSIVIPDFLPQESDFWGIHFPLSNILSTVAAIILNYYLSIWFVFEQGKHSKKREFFYFMMLSLGTTLLSLFFFQIFFRWVFRENIDVNFFVFSPEILSKIAAIITVSVLNFSIKKRIIFNG